MRECIGSLNCLAAADGRVRATLDCQPRSSCLSATQESVLQQVRERVDGVGPDSTVRSDREALTALLKTHDFYEVDINSREPFDGDRLNILKGTAPPRALAPRLSGEPAELLANFRTKIERSAAELDALYESGEVVPVRPYMCPRLASDRRVRIEFLRALVKLGLGGFRRRIKGKVGFFFIRKKTGMQRMVVDARGPNQCHRRPPHSRLGSPAAVAALDLSDVALRAAGIEPSSAELWMSTLDLVDYFYQFHGRDLASWWGVDFPERADVWGVAECWCPELRDFTPVEPWERLFFVFEGMPMGWSWALYFAQAAMETPFERALGAPRDGIGGLLRDGRPPPLIGKGRPVGSVYVDNGAIFAASREDCIAGDRAVRRELAAADLVIGDSTPPARSDVLVGYDINLEKRQAAHLPRRTWMLYRATRALVRIGGMTRHVGEVYIGHVVSYFMLQRAGLAALFELYKFLQRTQPEGFTRFTASEIREMFVLRGLFFVAAVRPMGLDIAPVTFCGDASELGYALHVCQPSPDAVRREMLYKEKWRFQLDEPVFDELSPQPPAAWEPLDTLGTEYARWLSINSQRGSTKSVPNKHRLMKVWDVRHVGGVPALSPSWSSDDRWSLVCKGAWLFDEPIFLKEARVEFMGLRHLCRATGGHRTRLLSLTDSLTSACTFEKMRSKNFGMLALSRRAAAYQLGCGIQWHHRFLFSELNCSDFESRAANRGELRPGETVHALKSRHIGALVGGAHTPSPLLVAPPRRRPTLRLASLIAEPPPRRMPAVPPGFWWIAPPPGLSSPWRPCSATEPAARRCRVGRETVFRARPALRRLIEEKLNRVKRGKCGPRGDVPSVPPPPDPHPASRPRVRHPRPRITSSRVPVPTSDSLGHHLSAVSQHVPISSSSIPLQPPSRDPPACLECFSGQHRLTSAWHESGQRTMPPMDICDGVHGDLFCKGIERQLLRWIATGRIFHIHFGTPCIIWSTATPAASKSEHADLGMRAARVTMMLVNACLKHNVFFTIENPAHSGLWKWGPMQRLLSRSSVANVYIDVCMYGAAYKKPTRLVGTLPGPATLGRTCGGGHYHERLSGTVCTSRDGVTQKGWRTSFASAYTPRLARAIARLTRAARGTHAASTSAAAANADRARWKACLLRAAGAECVSLPEAAAPLRKLPANDSREWPEQRGWDFCKSYIPRRG